MTADAYDDALEDAARAAGAQGEDDPRDRRDGSRMMRRRARAARDRSSFALARSLPRSMRRAGRRPRGVPRPASISEAIALLSKVPAERQRLGRRAARSRARATRRSASTTKRKRRRVARHRRRRAAARSGTRSAKCCSCAASARPAESAFVRAGGRARVGQPDRGAQSRRAALRSRRARPGDEGVRPVHRRLQRGRRRESHERRARRRRDRRRISRRQRPAAVQGRAQGVRPRAVSRSARTPTRRSSSASCSCGSTTSPTRRRRSRKCCRRIRTIRARCSARRCGCRPTASRRRLAASRGAGRESGVRRSAHVCTPRCCSSLEDYAAAQQDIDRALKVNPTSRARARRRGGDQVSHARPGRLRGAAAARARARSERRRSLQRRSPSWRRRCGCTSPPPISRSRRVALDAKDWHAWSLLGMNQMRLGQIDRRDARASRRRSRATRTTCGSRTRSICSTRTRTMISTTSEHFQFMIEKTESPILSIYLKDLAEQAYTTFATKYAYTPPPPIRIEVYRSHADFSVRTVGLAGLGALGVSFGTTLAFDSPAAKDAGPFNWGSTVWHELAHTFTLGTHGQPRSALVVRRAVGVRGASRAAGLGLQRDAGFPRGVQGGQARAGEPDERRVHASGVSASRCSSRTTRRRSCAS